MKVINSAYSIMIYSCHYKRGKCSRTESTFSLQRIYALGFLAASGYYIFCYENWTLMCELLHMNTNAPNFHEQNIFKVHKQE